MADIGERKALNLDELFGQARAVKIIHNGREYELLKLEAISPKQSMKFQKMQNRAIVLQNAGGDDLSDEEAEQIETLFDEMLTVLCKDLPLYELTFLKKMRILTFYVEETQGKKALETALKKATGARSSRA